MLDSIWPIALGLVLVGLETGFIYAYRAGILICLVGLYFINK